MLGAGGVVSDGLSSQDGKTRLLEMKTKAAPSSANLSASAMVAVVLIEAVPCGSDSHSSIPVTAAQRIATDLEDSGICHFRCDSDRSRRQRDPVRREVPVQGIPKRDASTPRQEPTRLSIPTISREADSGI